ESSERSQAERGGPLAAHDDERRRAVARLRAVAGGDGAARPEDRLERGEPARIGVPADALVGIEARLLDPWPSVLDDRRSGGNRDDLVAEPAGILGRRGTLVAAQRPRVLGVAIDAEPVAHLLGRDAH